MAAVSTTTSEAACRRLVAHLITADSIPAALASLSRAAREVIAGCVEGHTDADILVAELNVLPAVCVWLPFVRQVFPGDDIYG